MKKLYQKRFKELSRELVKLEKTIVQDQSIDFTDYYIDEQLLIKWNLKARDAILKVFGEESNYFTNFEDIESKSNNYYIFSGMLNPFF